MNVYERFFGKQIPHPLIMTGFAERCCSSGRACELCRRDLRIFLVRNRKASGLAKLSRRAKARLAVDFMREEGPTRATVLRKTNSTSAHIGRICRKDVVAQVAPANCAG